MVRMVKAAANQERRNPPSRASLIPPQALPPSSAALVNSCSVREIYIEEP